MQVSSRPIIDFHVHLFPDKVAERAVQSISDYYGLPMRGTGTVDNLRSVAAAHDVRRFVVHGTATRPDQVQAINDYLVGACAQEERLVGFGSLHPGMENAEAELERIQSLGLCGIKLHPDFQDFAIDDPAALSLYALVEGRMPLMLHMGDEHRDHSSPERLARILDRFPDLVLIGAHLGGYLRWDESLKLLAGRNLYFDTSSSLEFMEPDHAVELIRRHGVERVLFGTDYPMWLYEDELERFDRLKLSAEEQEQVLYRNAAALLGMA